MKPLPAIYGGGIVGNGEGDIGSLGDWQCSGEVAMDRQAQKSLFSRKVFWQKKFIWKKFGEKNSTTQIREINFLLKKKFSEKILFHNCVGIYNFKFYKSSINYAYIEKLHQLFNNSTNSLYLFLQLLTSHYNLYTALTVS